MAAEGEDAAQRCRLAGPRSVLRDPRRRACHQEAGTAVDSASGIGESGTTPFSPR